MGSDLNIISLFVHFVQIAQQKTGKKNIVKQIDKKVTE